MKKVLYLILSTVVLTFQDALCFADTINPDLQNSLKSPEASNLNGISIVFSLVFVVLLIYITGIIYQKLNVLGAKTVKEHIKKSNLNKAVVISTTAIGQNRNLHVVELNDKRYLIGSAQNSISLIKEIEIPQENITEKLKTDEKIKKKSENPIDEGINTLYGDSLKDSKEVDDDSDDDDVVNVYKKYL